MSDKILQQFSSFTSFVEPSFWHKLCQVKLDVDKLEEKERLIWGYYSNIDSKGDLLVDVTAFNREADKRSQHRLAIQGTLINKNTIEAFRECDKAELLQQQGKLLANDVSSGEALKNPNLAFGRFLVLSFADLKKYHFYYWFAFLAPKNLNAYNIKTACSITTVLTNIQIEDLEKQLIESENKHHFCVCLSSSGAVNVLPFSSYGEQNNDIATGDKVFLGFADPSNMNDVPGWPLRSLLWLATSKWPQLCGQSAVDVLCVRQSVQPGGRLSAASSIILQLSLESASNEQEVQWVGWERNERGKLGPRLANLSSSMDPIRLAESAVDLNLKLMKWRLLPQMDLDTVKNAKCLLLGAGTLGCAVARVLLGWGVRKITFVDSGRVGYSNPVRQSLFLHKHCLAGGAFKADAAAESLKDIFPGVEAEGIQLSIPMPGHTVTESQLLEVQNDIKELEDLIKKHDVVFLLTDTRESRWLPSLLAKLHGKIVINAALGFDSFLVMRHGMQSSTSEEAGSSSVPDCSQKNIPGHQLGCYFCNDVVAPRNSMASRSLDQQCTVVRPGVSQIAAALAVELLVSILQHPDRGCAPASSDPEQLSIDTGCLLGLVPHSIRGFLAQFQLVLPASHAFARCAACSSMVLEEYKSRGFDFLMQAFNSPGYLEEITGLAALQQQSLDAEVWALSDSEDTE